LYKISELQLLHYIYNAHLCKTIIKIAQQRTDICPAAHVHLVTSLSNVTMLPHINQVSNGQL